MCAQRCYSLNMTNTIPPITDVAKRLHAMTARQIQMLALLSGVSEHTILKIRSGQTEDPHYKAIWKILPLIRRAVREVQ